MGRRRVPKTITISPELVDLVEEIAAAYGDFSAFIEAAMLSYAKHLPAGGRAAAKHSLPEGLLRHTIEQAREAAAVAKAREHAAEIALQEVAEEEAARTASDAATLRFETADDLVRHYRPLLLDSAPDSAAWRNLARRHGKRLEDIRAAAARAVNQTQLPKGVGR